MDTSVKLVAGSFCECVCVHECECDYKRNKQWKWLKGKYEGRREIGSEFCLWHKEIFIEGYGVKFLK